MSQKIKRHSIVPQRPLSKCENLYTSIDICKYDSNLLGFINMRPIHEKVTPINDVKEVSFTQGKDCVNVLSDQRNNEVKENHTIVKIGKEVTKCFKNIKVGTSPLNKGSDIKTYENKHRNVVVENTEKPPLPKTNVYLMAEKQSNRLNVMPVICVLKQGMIKGFKTKKNVRLLQLHKDALKTPSSSAEGKNILLNNRPIVKELKQAKISEKTSLKPEVKILNKIPEPKTKAPVVKSSNLQGKKIVIVTRNENVMLKPLKSLSVLTTQNPLVVRQPVNTLRTLNDNRKQTEGSKPNIKVSKILLVDSKQTQIKNVNLKTDNDKTVKKEDNGSGSSCSKEDNKLIESPCNKLNAINNEKEKNVSEHNCSEKEMETNLCLIQKSDSDLNKDALKEDSSGDGLDLMIEENLSKEAITEIILGTSSSKPLKEEKIELETKDKALKTETDSNSETKDKDLDLKPKKKELDSEATKYFESETKDKSSKKCSETRKRQIDNDSVNENKDNKRLCVLSDRIAQNFEGINKENTHLPSKDDLNNKTDNTTLSDSIGYSPTYQHKNLSDNNVSDTPKETFYHEDDLFGNDLENLENFGDFLKDSEIMSTLGSPMQSKSPSWSPLIIDEDRDEMEKVGNVLGKDKLLHEDQRIDPFLIHFENKPKHEKWKVMFFLDMKNCLRKDFAGNMPIHEAVLKEDMKMLHRQCLVLLARIKTVDVKNNEGSTPLHLAITHRVNPDIICILLKFKASVNTPDNEGNNAFHLAAYSSDVEYVRRLLEYSNERRTKSDIHNFDGFTPLMISVLNNDYVIVEQLLLGGFSPNLKDQKSGRTALFHAVELNKERLVKLLLHHNADTKIENFFGTSPRDAVFELSDVHVGIRLLVLEKKKFEKKVVPAMKREMRREICRQYARIKIKAKD